MFRLIEHGVQDRHNQRMYGKEAWCSGSASFFTPASMVDTLPAFLVFAWGFGGTVMVLVVELTLKHWRTVRSWWTRANNFANVNVNS